jgi:hypothetical protein
MADQVIDRVDREGRTFRCKGCATKEVALGRAPMGWLRVSALVAGAEGHTDDWTLLGLCCSTACLVDLVVHLDERARAAT